MSKESDSRDYYHNYRSSGPLPSIHETLGDVLDQPVDPRRLRGTPSERQALPSGSYSAHNNRRESNAYSTYPASGSQHSRGGSHPSQASQSQPSRERRDSRARESSDPIYGVYTTTSTGELVLKRSSTQDDYKKRPLKASQEDPARRYACDECGERFDRPSALEMHLRSHTGEKPFLCGYPGCGKRFASGGNRTRHERTHEPYSAFQERNDERGHAGPSSSSHYYSSRRK